MVLAQEVLRFFLGDLARFNEFFYWSDELAPFYSYFFSRFCKGDSLGGGFYRVEDLLFEDGVFLFLGSLCRFCCLCLSSF